MAEVEVPHLLDFDHSGGLAHGVVGCGLPSSLLAKQSLSDAEWDATSLYDPSLSSVESDPCVVPELPTVGPPSPRLSLNSLDHLRDVAAMCSLEASTFPPPTAYDISPVASYTSSPSPSSVEELGSPDVQDTFSLHFSHVPTTELALGGESVLLPSHPSHPVLTTTAVVPTIRPSTSVVERRVTQAAVGNARQTGKRKYHARAKTSGKKKLVIASNNKSGLDARWDKKLLDMSTQDLNHLLKDNTEWTAADVKALREARRRKKNRAYAQKSRLKRLAKYRDMEDVKEKVSNDHQELYDAISQTQRALDTLMAREHDVYYACIGHGIDLAALGIQQPV